MTTRTWDEMRGDTFDSREIIERLDELDAMFSADGMSEEEIEERATLREITEEAADYCTDWQYGESFIPSDDFGEYARELAEDIGAVNPEIGWPMSYIDWPAAADALRMDYTSYTFDGIEYLARS